MANLVWTADAIKVALLKVSQGRFLYSIKGGEVGINARVECVCASNSNHKWVTSFGALYRLKSGCPHCAGNARKTTEQVNCIVEHIAKGRYFFEITDFKNANSKIQCRCKTCDYEWCASYDALVNQKQGCPKCAGVKKLTLTEATQRLTEVSQNRYTFELTEYKNNRQKVKCKCNVCGYEWESKYDNLVGKKCGCKVCGYHAHRNRLKTDTQQIYNILERCANVGYIYILLGDYKNANYKNILRYCKKCRQIKLVNFISVNQGTGCFNQCFKPQKNKSRPENEIVAYLKESFPQLEIHQSVRSLIKNLKGNHFMEIDIYIPALKLAFEFNGRFWHKDNVIKNTRAGFQTAQQYHDYKTAECAKLGIKLIHIDEADWLCNKSATVSFLNDMVLKMLG